MITSNVKKLMKEKNYTLRGLATKSGLSDKTILTTRSNNINKCRLYTLETLAEHLDCKVKDLFEEE